MTPPGTLVPMENSIEIKDVWTAAAVLIGFQVTGFLWRLQREMEMAKRRKTNWFPPADYLNLFSLLATVLVFVLPITSLASSRAAATLLGLSVILFGGYPFALVGHYGLLFNRGRPRLPGEYVTLQEGIAVAMTFLAASLYLACRISLHFNLDSATSEGAVARLNRIWHASLTKDLVVSAAGSLIALLLLYGLYLWSSRRALKDKPYAGMWWLPKWNCFRFVIRNMHGERSLTDVKYAARLRQLKPSSPGCSVNTLIDTRLTEGQVIILPKGYDYPVLCFRLEKTDGKVHFIHTDKVGTQLGSYPIAEDFREILVEYSVRIQTLGLLKHEICRMLSIPYSEKAKGDTLDSLFSIQQAGTEQQFPLTFVRAEEIRVSI
jgi:hypothetical protein